MPLPVFTSRRRALVALVLVVPALALAPVAGAALWLHGHGGLASGLTVLARGAALAAGALDGAPATPAAMATVLAPPAPAAGWVWIAGGDEGRREFSFALIEPGRGATTCFSLDESRSAGFRRIQRAASVPTLWFAEDGAEFVVTDAAAVERARAACRPLQEIGGEMGRVGAQQGRIGAALGRHGGRLGALGGRLGALSARLATMEVSRAERARLEDELSDIRAEMERVQERMEAVRTETGDDREALSERMAELSKRHKAALAAARAGLRELLDEVRANGRAQRVESSI
jgi:hypothetical protein